MAEQDQANVRVGIVGLGRMGTAMARRLLDRGWHVAGYDIDESRVRLLEGSNLEKCQSGSDVARRSNIVIVSLFDDKQLEQELASPSGVLVGADADTIVVDTGTIHPETSRSWAEACLCQGTGFLAATLSGNSAVAAAGKLGIFCSGPKEHYDAVKQILNDLSASHVWLGEGEEARYAKLAVNLMVSGTMVLLAEAIAMFETAGMERSMLFDVLKSSVISSQFIDYKTGPLIDGDYSPTMAAKDLRKDLGLILDVARGGGAAVPVTATVDQIYALTERAGLGDLDFASVVLLNAEKSRD